MYMQHSRRSVVAVVLLLQMELNVYEIRVCILIFIRYLCLRVATRRAHECVCVSVCVERCVIRRMYECMEIQRATPIRNV